MTDLIKFLEANFTYQPANLPDFKSVSFFVLFLPFFFLNILFREKNKIRTYIITGFSVFMYYRFGGNFVLLLMGTALIDWFCALMMVRTAKIQRLILLWVSICLNIGLLMYFKYTLFFIEIFNDFTSSNITIEKILMPVGISFYTFRSMSYVLDVYREEIELPERNYFIYLGYLAFFPTLLMGPIARGIDVLPQFQKTFALTPEQISKAIFFFLGGLFKKVVIADFLAENYVNRIFDAPANYTGLECLFASYFYGIQLYCDFSGYTDMALGVALILGIEIVNNFNTPFLAQNISEFWRRWHISLSSWFNDYVFMPLNFGWRCYGKIGVITAVILTFLLSGLWHGANWTFILWGGVHGLAIAYETLSASWRKKLSKNTPKTLYKVCSIFLTYQFLALTFIFFNAKDVHTIGVILRQLTNNFAPYLFLDWLVQYKWVIFVFIFGFILHFIPNSVFEKLRLKFQSIHWVIQAVIIALFILGIYQVQSVDGLSFVYLQF